MKVTWLGEDTDSEAGPSFCDWNGVRFHKGVPVEITGEKAIEKARGNRFFSVSDQPQEADNGEKEEDAPWIEPQQAEKKPSDYTPVKSKKPKKKKPKVKKQEPEASAEPALPVEPRSG
jgi:hypothetical protein